MKRNILSKVASLLFGTIMIFNSICIPVSAEEKNPFSSEDSLRKKIIASASDEGRFTCRNIRVMGGSDSYIVTFKRNASFKEIKTALKGYNYRLLANSEERVFLVRIGESNVFFEKNEGIIEHLEEDKVKELSAYYPNDTYSSVYELELIEMPEAWEYGFGKREVIVAVVDSGVDRDHEDLQGANILSGYDYENGQSIVNNDVTGHGTKVTGIIAATRDNGKGCCGIASGCTVLPIKITNGFGKVYTSDFIDSLYFAADCGANVINMSLGSYEKLESEEKAIKYANNKGCILVAASGNEGNHKDYAGMKCYPASYDGVISVGAVDEAGNSCVFSQYNDAVDISAPGSGLSLLSSDGGYVSDSGTSFSTAYVSGAAALALSCLDEGVKINSDQFDFLISSYASGEKGLKTGAGILNAEQMVIHTNFPLVSGVENGKVYYDNVTLFFNRGKAFLDGENFESGSLCKHTGEHTLIVEDGEKKTEVSFTTDNLPLGYSLKEGDGYSYITFPFGKATLNGHPYLSGDPISTDGTHTLVLKGLYGNQKTFEFDLSFAKPTIKGVENGETYEHPVRISVATGGKIYLNGKEQKKEFTVFEEGQYTLLIKQNGNLKTTVNFTISYENSYSGNEEQNPHKYTVFDSSVSNASALCGFGVVAVWNDKNRGIRLFDAETSNLVKYINVGENVKSVHFGEEKLYIAGTNHVFAIDGNKIKESSELINVFEFHFPISSADFCGKVLYYAESSSVNSGTVKKLSLDSLAEEEICFVRSIPDVLSYDNVTNYVAFGKKDENKIYVSPISGESVSVFSPFNNIKSGFIFKNGKIACGGEVFSVKENKLIFSVNDNKALFFDGKTLITEKGIYDVDTFEAKGFHAMELSKVSYSFGKYCASFDDVSIYVSKSLPSATCDVSMGEKTQNTDFVQLNPISKKISHSVIQDGKIYASGIENALYIFDANNMKYISEIFLPFVPTGLESYGEYVYAYSDRVHLIAVYSLKSETLVQVKTPNSIDDLAVWGNYIAFISEGSLYIYTPDGEMITSDESGEYVSITISHDGMNLYATRYKSFYNVLTSYILPTLEIEYERILEYEASNIFCDSTYIYINTATYLTRNGNIAASCAAKIYGRTFNTFITSKGLFSEGEYISSYPLSSDEFIVTESGKLFLFRKDGIYTVGNVYGGDYNTDPFVSGIENGGNYTGKVTVSFEKGIGYLDGKRILTNSEISEGGNHTLTIVLPLGLSFDYRFSINASLNKIRIKGGNTALKVNDTVKFKVEFLPLGSPEEKIMFYCEDDCVSVTEDGTLTALKPGEAILFAATDDGRLVTNIKVTVLSSMLDFTPSYLGIDRTDGILYGISSGTTVNSLINYLAPSLRGDAKVYDGEKEATGIVKSGMKIVLQSKKGEVLDSLLVSVTGDCNGDGNVDIGDLSTAYKIMSDENAEAVFIKSADFSNTGTVDVADTFTYKEIILEGEKNVSSDNSGIPYFSGNVNFNAFREEDGTVTLKLSVNGDFSEIPGGISGKILYDKKSLTFISINKTGLIYGAEETEEGLSFLTVFENNSPCIEFTFLPNSNSEISFFADNVKIFFKETQKTDKLKSVLKPYAKEELSSLIPSDGKLIPEFSPNVFSYALRLPFGVNEVEFRTESGEILECTGNKNFSDGDVITVLYGDVEYKITLIIENEHLNDTTSHILFIILISVLSLSILALFAILAVFGYKNFAKAKKVNQ